MMMDDIGGYLQGKGVGTVGEDLFLGSFPSVPERCVVLFEYQGRPVWQPAGTVSPGLQVCARAKDDYDWCQGKLKEIDDILKPIGFEDGELAEGAVLGGTMYFRVAPAASGVMPLGVDSDGNTRIARNYYVIMEDG